MTSLSSLTANAICRDMFCPVTFRPLVTIRAVIRMFCFILRLKLTSASSGMASFLSFVQSRLDGKLARSFTINSDSRFRAPCGLLGFPLRNTLMIGTLDSFLFLHCWLAGPSPGSRLYHLLIETGHFIGLKNCSWFLRSGLVF